MTRWGGTPGTEPEPGAQDALPVRRAVRLRMKARPVTPGVGGARWPRSRDPAAAFPELVLVMSSWVGPVRRVTYRLDEWKAAGRELVTDGWPVELAGSVTLERSAAGSEVVASVEEMLTSNGVRLSLHSVDEVAPERR